MATALQVDSVACPSCAQRLDAMADDAYVCMGCGWRGTVLRFRPVNLQVAAGGAALTDDVVCAHHPTKRATATCAGTGAYICDLCAVEMNGQTYSVQYLDSVGKNVADKAFDRYMPRPDGYITTYALLMLLFACPMIFLLPVALVYGAIKLRQAGRLRREDALYAQVVTRGRLILLWVVFIAVTLVFGGAGVAMIGGMLGH